MEVWLLDKDERHCINMRFVERLELIESDKDAWEVYANIRRDCGDFLMFTSTTELGAKAFMRQMTRVLNGTELAAQGGAS